MPQLAQRFRLDLANSFAGHIELFTDFLEGVIGVHFDTEAHTKHFCFTGCQAGENVLGRLPQAFEQSLIVR